MYMLFRGDQVGMDGHGYNAYNGHDDGQYDHQMINSNGHVNTGQYTADGHITTGQYTQDGREIISRTQKQSITQNVSTDFIYIFIHFILLLLVLPKIFKQKGYY